MNPIGVPRNPDRDIRRCPEWYIPKASTVDQRVMFETEFNPGSARTGTQDP